VAVTAPARSRNFAALAWHGTFLAAATALAQPTTLLPAYVALLGGSPLVVGTMLTVLLAGGVLPQLAFAHVVEASPRKRPFLLWAVYSRAGSFLLLGVLSLVLAGRGRGLLMALLFALLAAFALGGSLGGVAYTDIYGKSIPPGQRGTFYASRQFLGSFAALAVTYGADLLLRRSHGAPIIAYAWLFTAAGALMALAGVGFVLVREAPGTAAERPPLGTYLRAMPSLWRRAPDLRALVAVENLASLHLMILPFYMLLAEAYLHVPASAAALYTMVQIIGGALSNLVWGAMNDRLGSASVLRACMALGAALPVLALVLARLAPAAYFLTFALLGAAVNSRTLAFNNVLVDIAPPELRATYTGLVGTLTAPGLVLPMLGGLLIGIAGYPAVFLGVAAVLALSLVTVGREATLAAPPKG
jgi:MFS family permease